MNNLDARARALVDAARDADRPTQVDRDRIRRGLAVQIAAGAVAASTVAVAGTLSAATKVALVVATVAVVGGGSIAARRMWRSPDSHKTGHAAHVVPSGEQNVAGGMPVAAPERLAATATPPAAPVAIEARAARIDKPRKRPIPTTTEMPQLPAEDALNAEVALLGRAREELRLGRPARALDLLAEYDRRFGNGVLGEERRAIAAIANCQAHPGSQARAQAEAFLRSAPSSPLAERVRATCIKPSVR